MKILSLIQDQMDSFMINFTNTDLLPLEILNSFWLCEKNYKYTSDDDSGKWMLFYDKSLINDAWMLAKKLYRENKLNGVISMKCSTAYINPRASTLTEGVIILHCNNSANESQIMSIGKNIIEMLNYKETKIIYYKTDLQTEDGTIATGCKNNHMYKLLNNLYEEKHLNLQWGNHIFLHAERPKKIERSYPTKKQYKKYPERYDNSVFEKLNEMNGDIKLRYDYEKWKNGINYKTNRKIEISGDLYHKLKQKFMIHSCGEDVLFDKLNSINIDEYLQETKRLIYEIDLENAKITEYNKSVDNLIEKIQTLEKWNDYIEFEGKYYGITNKVVNNIHRENDCFGKMIFTPRQLTSYYKCSNCHFMIFIPRNNLCNKSLSENCITI